MAYTSKQFAHEVGIFLDEAVSANGHIEVGDALE